MALTRIRSAVTHRADIITVRRHAHLRNNLNLAITTDRRSTGTESLTRKHVHLVDSIYNDLKSFCTVKFVDDFYCFSYSIFPAVNNKKAISLGIPWFKRDWNMLGGESPA
jgi:hypothetical protein